MSMRRSKMTCVFDFFLYLLFFGSTGIISYFLWTRVHWLLAIILAFPIYRVIGYPIIFMTAPLYNWLTPENKVWSIGCKAMFEGDHDTASKAFEAIERWDNGGDCDDLQECYERVRKSKTQAGNPQDWWSFEREDDRIEAFLNSREHLFKDSVPPIDNQSVDGYLNAFVAARKSQCNEDLQKCRSREEKEVVTGFWGSYLKELCGQDCNC